MSTEIELTINESTISLEPTMSGLLKKNFVYVLLILVMIATRGSHFATAVSLSDASWAIFLLLGFYSARKSLFIGFIALAALIDYVAVTKLGVSDYCITPAYVFLVPAYFSMWLAGRLFAKYYQPNAMSLLSFTRCAVIGTAACEIISSGSFYFLGGRFGETSLSSFAARLVEYFPYDLMSASIYLGIAALIHVTIIGIKHSSVVKSA